MPGLVRIPAVAFTNWDRIPGRRSPTAPIPRLAPNLAVEVLSRSNTRRELAVNRQDYFAAGVEIVWEIYPRRRTVMVYTFPTAQRRRASGPGKLGAGTAEGTSSQSVAGLAVLPAGRRSPSRIGKLPLPVLPPSSS